MKTFKQYILLESDTTRAFEMEHVIVSSAGGPAFTSKTISKDVGDTIVKSLKLKGKGIFPKNTYSASSKWNEYFPDGAKGATLTPKTDFKIGKKRISLKTGGSAQLMSGGKNEAAATFGVAAEASNTSLDQAVSDMQAHIENLLPTTNMTKLNIKGNKTDLTKAGLFKDIDILKKADEAHQAFKKDLRSLFTNNSAFAEAFVFEAMTGKIKFDNSDGTADNFLVTDYKGNAAIYKVVSAKDSYVKKIAKQVKPDVKFKSSQNKAAAHKTLENPQGKTGYYNFWSAVGIGIDMVVKEAIDNSEDDLITEGWLNDVVSKITSWFGAFWAKIKKHIGKSWNSLMEFADITPKIKFNNEVDW